MAAKFSYSCKCDYCKNDIQYPSKVIMISGYTLRFCSYKCACNYMFDTYEVDIEESEED